MNILYDFLLAQGGPITRWRTANELVRDFSPAQLARLYDDLITSTLVKKWLDNLKPSVKFNDLHGSKPTTYENAINRLADLGLRAGMPPLDERVQIFREWLAVAQASVDNSPWGSFSNLLVAAYLARIGYVGDQAVRSCLMNRLDVIADFAIKMDFEIYTDRNQYSDIPKGFHQKPLVKPELTEKNQLILIHDLYAMASYPNDWMDDSIQRKINSVLAYVLDPRYQALMNGYGLMRYGNRRYFAIGWSAHLAGYHGFRDPVFIPNSLVQHLSMMVNFPFAVTCRWFMESMAHLERFQTDRGTFIFPRTYLPEKPGGYWVSGYYYALEEKRRSNLAFELESTFWMMKIKSLLASSS